MALVYWEVGNLSTKPDVLREIERTDYNLLVSYINGLIFRPHHLERAHYGAINIHPAPPEHPGLYGWLCQPVIRRDIRTHHGVTVHEVDEEIDHGPIYRVRRWEVDEHATIESVLERASRSASRSSRRLPRSSAAVRTARAASRTSMKRGTQPMVTTRSGMFGAGSRRSTPTIPPTRKGSSTTTPTRLTLPRTPTTSDAGPSPLPPAPARLRRAFYDEYPLQTLVRAPGPLSTPPLEAQFGAEE